MQERSFPMKYTSLLLCLAQFAGAMQNKLLKQCGIYEGSADFKEFHKHYRAIHGSDSDSDVSPLYTQDCMTPTEEEQSNVSPLSTLYTQDFMTPAEGEQSDSKYKKHNKVIQEIYEEKKSSLRRSDKLRQFCQTISPKTNKKSHYRTSTKEKILRKENAEHHNMIAKALDKCLDGFVQRGDETVYESPNEEIIEVHHENEKLKMMESGKKEKNSAS